MKKLTAFLCQCSLLLMVPAAHAAGTYYTGSYQSPQRARYTQNSYANTVATRNGAYSSQGVSNYNRGQYANAGYNTGYSNQNVGRAQQNVQKKDVASVSTDVSKNGLYLNAGVSKQSAMWQFEMNTAKSKLHYDNLDWLVMDLGGKYVFDAGKAKMQIDAGLQYGVQMGESSMVDDDISHGGYLYADFSEDYGDNFNGSILGHALSVGTSKNGSMLGFNAGVGLTEFWRWGNLKITPSIGWRYLKYKLETSNNFGNVVLSGNFDNSCLMLDDGSTQCAPIIGIFSFDNNGPTYSYPGYVYFDKNNNMLKIDESGNFVDANGDPAEPAYAGVIADGYADAEGSFYFQLPDVSHSYEVEWSGPYLALDMQYDINANNMFAGRVELGMPSYNAIGDQPYRVDWAHPKSVEDKGSIGSAFHFGAGASWSTAISDAVSLSIGVTYDYYTVSDVDATTYLNASHWEGEYENAFSIWESVLNTKYSLDFSDSQINYYMVHGISRADGIVIGYDSNGDKEYLEASPEYVAVVRSNGWKDTVDNEIESFYKSLGVRIGINARF